MLRSTGFFRGIDCPFYAESGDAGGGRNGCNRAYCHFRHSQQRRPSYGAPPADVKKHRESLSAQKGARPWFDWGFNSLLGRLGPLGPGAKSPRGPDISVSHGVKWFSVVSFVYIELNICSGFIGSLHGECKLRSLLESPWFSLLCWPAREVQVHSVTSGDISKH